MLPGDGRHAGDQFRRGLVARGALSLVHTRKERCVVVDDRVGDQARTFVPELLLGFGMHAQFATVDVGDRPAQAVYASPRFSAFCTA